MSDAAWRGLGVLGVLFFGYLLWALEPVLWQQALVALLALASPKEKAPVGEADTGVRVEQVEPQVVHPAELEAQYVEVHRQS